MNKVGKSYSGKKAVENLSFEVAKGEFLGFLGPNGAGKTTTIRLLTGILRADEGQISISELDISRKKEVSRVIGVLSESGGFYNWMTGEEYLKFFEGLYRTGNKNSQALQLLENVGLTQQADKSIGAYSRGMKQRLGIARALINGPEILFLDEPTLGLDPQGQDDIMKLLKKFNEAGMTIFYSSHLLYEVAGLCSKIIIIDRGSLIASGTLPELQKISGNTGLKEIFLSMTGVQHV
jgi:ABC-type multidrug transport system ATPase subunit